VRPYQDTASGEASVTGSAMEGLDMIGGSATNGHNAVSGTTAWECRRRFWQRR
jgi:hypothetical protein